MIRNRILARSIAAGLVALAASSAAHAAENFLVATGDPKFTYSKMFNQMRAHCGAVPGMPPLAELNTTGTVKNVAELVGNQVDAAIVQADYLFLRAATDEAVKGIYTVVALHPEEVHFAARADTKTEGGFGLGGFRVGGTKVSYDTVDSLKGRAVGAVGGSVPTARMVSARSGLNFDVLEFPTNEALKQALLDGKIDALVAVGGSPLTLIAELDGRQFKLLPATDTLFKNERLMQNYGRRAVTYDNLGSAGAGVAVLATDALLVARTYDDPELLAALGKLRACIHANVSKLKNTRNTHPKWQLVRTDYRGQWQWYDLPNTDAAAAAPRAAGAGAAVSTNEAAAASLGLGAGNARRTTAKP